MTDMDSVLSEAASAAEAASNGKALDVVARWGFAMMALLHVKDELQHFEGTRRGRAISGLGVAGHVAKGVALKLVGMLFIVAAVKINAAESTGLDGSLQALGDHPWGPVLLTAIGFGFICYGVFALVRSRFGRM